MTHFVAPPTDTVTDPGLFDAEPWRVEIPKPDPTEKLSPDRRRTLRQLADVEAGTHPLTRTRVHEDAERRCGNCRFKQAFNYHRRRYLKCVWIPLTWSAEQAETTMPPRMSHSAATDVRNWWPGCGDHEYGDTKLSPDAARSGPPVVERGE